MLADELDYVLGVDTHRDEHVMAVVTAPAGAVVAGAAAPANARGYRELLRVAERHAPGRRAWAIEGTGSYGAGLARFLASRRETVFELSRTPRAERRLRGKDDELDALRTARAALASQTLALPRAGEQREALRLLLVAPLPATSKPGAADGLTSHRSFILHTGPGVAWFARRVGGELASEFFLCWQPPSPASHSPRVAVLLNDGATLVRPRNPKRGCSGGSAGMKVLQMDASRRLA
jgi:hypothetical protein